MNHEVVPRPCKRVIGCWTHPCNYFGHKPLRLHQGTNVRVTMEFKLPKRHYSRHTLSTDMVHPIFWRETQNGCSSRKRQRPEAQKNCYNNFIMTIFQGGEGKRRRSQQQTIEWWNFIFLKITLFGHILSKSTHSRFAAWSFLLIHMKFTPNEKPQKLHNLIS